MASAQIVHIAHCLAGCPQYSDATASLNNEVVVRQLFAASINNENGLADWLAYRVLADSVGVASLLPRIWYKDELLSPNAALTGLIDNTSQIIEPELRNAEEASYQISEITILSEDQGRLVPMSSFAGTPYWSELNYLSNMAPLPSDLRVGSWSRLDQAVNSLVDRVGEVFVISGPIHSLQGDSAAELPASPVAYFKIVATASSHAAFVFEKDLPVHARFCAQLSSIATIEEQTGLSFFPRQQNTTASNLHAELACDL